MVQVSQFRARPTNATDEFRAMALKHAATLRRSPPFLLEHLSAQAPKKDRLCAACGCYGYSCRRCRRLAPMTTRGPESMTRLR